MYVLHSFSHAAVATLGKEQFLALYLTAGVFASFASFCFKYVVQQPGLSLGAVIIKNMLFMNFTTMEYFVYYIYLSSTVHAITNLIVILPL